MKKYDIIYADPPWDYKCQKKDACKGTGCGMLGSARRAYDCLSLAELKALPVGELASPDCLLFMWASSPHLDQAIELMKAWGFDWATVGFVWDKQRICPGYYTLSQVELCLIGKRGRIPKPRGVRNARQLISVKSGRHSAKPEEVRQAIESMFPQQTKIELFAREEYEGWDCWGNEVRADVLL